MIDRLSRVVLGLASVVSIVLVGASACSSAGPEGAPNPNGKDEGSLCTQGADCKSLTCSAGKCSAVVSGGNPNDKVKNGTETDVDCGGAAAPKCADGKACNAATDCESAACVGGKCKAPAPDDKLKNGDETDVDCGGTKAPKCAVDKACAKNDDCSSDACSYAKKCVEHKSCTGQYGGDTCGAGETGAADAKHESCCTTVTDTKGLKIGKYLITAGRMRAFVERYNGNLQQWAATKPKGWDDSWNSELPSTLEEANTLLGPDTKRGCNITTDGKGARTYWQPPLGEDKNDFPQNVLDEKALNCVSWHMAQALCMLDGGRLPTSDEVQGIMTNDGDDSYPWQFQDMSTYKEKVADDRLVHRYSYETPNPPADMRKEGDSPLDRSFWIAPPGRRPKGANKIGVQDAVGLMLNWVNDDPLQFAWTMSWEEHPKSSSPGTWPVGGGFGSAETEKRGYYALSARCVFE